MPGLQLFARRHQLTPEEAAKFHVGQIVRNATLPCDESRGRHGDDPPFQHLSNHLFDLTKAEHGTNWEYTWPTATTTKFSDIYEHEGKTQILLLHLDDYRWKWMEHVNLDLPVDIVADSRERFGLSKAHAEPIPEVTSRVA